jgi:hypothetical protein
VKSRAVGKAVLALCRKGRDEPVQFPNKFDGRRGSYLHCPEGIGGSILAPKPGTIDLSDVGACLLQELVHGFWRDSVWIASRSLEHLGDFGE